MKAWQFDPESQQLSLGERALLEPRQGAVIVRIEAAMVLSYMEEVLTGARGATYPERPFVPGTNAIGTVERVGAGVYHLKAGQRVSLHPHARAAENVRFPAEILMGHLARHGDCATDLQQDWVDGAFAESVEWPGAQVTPIDALGAVPGETALALAKLVVPYGGLLRVGLKAGEVAAVNGATGFYGSAGVAVALAMGASRVLAVGRSPERVAALAALDPKRVVPVVLSGEETNDIAAIRQAAGAGLDVALDLVGANSSQSTSTVLRSLSKGGRLAMMGSCSEPLQVDFAEILINDWLIAGQFMYPSDAVRRLVEFAASGLLDLGKIQPKVFPLDQLPAAMKHATTMTGLELTAVVP